MKWKICGSVILFICLLTATLFLTGLPLKQAMADSDPEMAVFGNGNEIGDGDGTPSITDDTDFGDVNIANGSVIITYTIYNTGSLDLTLTDAGNNYVAVTGDGFSLTTLPALSVIPGGGNTTFQVTFDPSASGVSDGTISIANDDIDENPYNFSITGLGTVTPTISNLNGDTVTYVENSSPVKLDAGGNAAANDNDGLGWDGGYVEATVSGTFPNSVIGIDGVNVLSGGDGVITAGETITVSGTDIGTADGTSYGQDGSLIIHLNSNATNALVTTLLQNITYRNTSENPSGYGDVIFYVQDTYETSSGSTVRVNLTGVNDPPTLTATGTNPTFTEAGASVDLYSGVSISTIEAGQTILQIVFTITNINDGSYEIMNIDGTNITLTDGFSTTTATNSMTVTVSVTGTTATVTVAKIGGISTAAMQTLIDTMTYMNTSENPNTSDRVVTLTSIQDNGGTDNGGDNTTVLSVVSTVTVVAVNDPPVISNLDGDTVSVVSGGAAVLIDLGSNTTVTDVDSTDFNNGFLLVSQASGTANGNFSFDGINVTSGGDEVIGGGETIAVSGIDIGTIHAVNDGQGGNDLRIDFNANATPARIATLIRNLMYDAPSGVGARSFELTVNDDDGGTATSIASTFNVDVTPNPPVITNLDGDTTIYDPFVGGEVICDVGTDADVTDPDNANFNGGNVTVTISAGGTPAEDVLGISTTG
ncbi:MAG: choice-of-anchor D domain-containing protein, partial [Dehalococcoidales bacterium]|nr:choice-of-anchor D domain-containing protein [Dehalococcoidales bacterium]